MSRSVPIVLVLAAGLLLIEGVRDFIGEARSEPGVARQVAPLGASEGVAWYVDLTSKRIVACRLRSDPATLACSAVDMP
jgi:hypothetical protein